MKNRLRSRNAFPPPQSKIPLAIDCSVSTANRVVGRLGESDHSVSQCFRPFSIRVGDASPVTGSPTPTAQTL